MPHFVKWCGTTKKSTGFKCITMSKKFPSTSSLPPPYCNSSIANNIRDGMQQVCGIRDSPMLRAPSSFSDSGECDIFGTATMSSCLQWCWCCHRIHPTQQQSSCFLLNTNSYWLAWWYCGVAHSWRQWEGHRAQDWWKLMVKIAFRCHHFQTRKW